jgi:predicted phosphohydrolase
MDLGGLVLVGARGWTAPDDPTAQPGDEAIFRREVERLRLSVADADRRFGRDLPRVAMTHYPPWIVGRAPTEVVGVLRDAGVSVCVYGHLHGADHALAVQGVHEGIRFALVAADAVDFAPVNLGSVARLLG